MSPPKNKVRSSRKKIARSTRTGSSILPLTMRVPKDPPRVVVDVIRHQTITDTLLALAAGTAFTYPVTRLIARIRLQMFSSASVSFSFQIISVSIWGDADTNGTIAVSTDSYTRTWEDSGSFTTRPAIAYRYDPPGRVAYTSSTSGNLFRVLSNYATAAVVHIKVAVWTGDSDAERASLSSAISFC